MTNVLITGGAGYVGSHCCKGLREAGFTPVGYDNFATGHRDFVKWGPVVEADIRDRQALTDALAAYAPVGVMHFAGLIAVGESRSDPGSYYDVSVAGTLRLREAMRTGDVGNLIFSSTAAVYGDPAEVPIREDMPKQPVNPYGNTKLAAEHMMDDCLTNLTPQVTVESDWANHALYFNAYGDFGIYADNSDEDYEDYVMEIGGRLDVRRSTNLRASAAYDHLHEERGSPNDVAGAEPTENDRLEADLIGSHRNNRLQFSLGGRYQMLDFDDTPTSLSGEINNGDRDRDIVFGLGQIGYEIQPGYIAFIRGEYNVVDYDANIDDQGLNRDSDGCEVVAGVELDLGRLLFDDLFVGYRELFFDDDQLDNVDGFTGGADLTWNVTALTTLIALASSEIRESTAIDQSGNRASSRWFSTVGLEAQHELLRNLLLGATASHSRDDFESINRADDIYRAGLSTTYLTNGNAYLRGSYRYRMRDSDANGEDFTENAVFVTLELQY